MSRNFGTTGQAYWLRSSHGSASYPLTMAVWANPTQVASGTTMISLCDLNNNGRAIRLNIGSTVGINVYNGSSYSASGGTPSANVWQHVGGVVSSSTSREVWLDGVSVGTDTNSINFPTVNRLSIGLWDRPATTSIYGGKLSNAAMWSAALSDSEMKALASGACPLMIRPESLLAYHPLGGLYGDNDFDVIRQKTFTVLGTPTWATDDPAGLIYPSTPQLVTAAAAGGGGGGDTYPASLIRLTSL